MNEKEFEEKVLPYLTKKKQHGLQKISYYKVFMYIVQVCKTGTSWRNVVIENKEITWQNLYYHFRKWSKNEAFKKIFEASLKDNKRELDLSILQIDGSQTPSKKGAKK